MEWISIKKILLQWETIMYLDQPAQTIKCQVIIEKTEGTNERTKNIPAITT